MLAKLIQAQGRQSCAPRAAFRARQVKRVLGATERRPQEPLQQPRWQAGVEVPTKHRCCICCEKNLTLFIVPTKRNVSCKSAAM